MNYWLMKSEPNEFSIDDLQQAPKQTTAWHGVRNYQARNYMRDQMKIGDGILFYHSSCKEPAVVGIATVVKEAYADDSAWDLYSEYYDAKSTPETPRWLKVDISFQHRFGTPVSLKRLKADAAFAEMYLIKKGSRLSIQPVTDEEWQRITKMGEEK